MRQYEKSLIRTLRRTCGLTQAELASIIECARLTVVELESGKLKLSQRMAEGIAVHTGVSKAWLLEGNYRRAPVCERDSQRPFTEEVFEMTRAEVLDPRIEPGDIAMIVGVLKSACAQLRAVASEAYRNDEIVYFHYKTREFLEGLEQRWTVPNKVGLTEAQFKQMLETDSRGKQTSKIDRAGAGRRSVLCRIQFPLHWRGAGEMESGCPQRVLR